MEAAWIDRVMRLNACIVAAETRVGEQVILLLEAAERGQDITAVQGQLASRRRSLDLLRGLQVALLEETKAKN